MRLLITGSSGLVGRALAAFLGNSGHEVCEYDISDGVSDIREPSNIGVAMRGCDGVIHLAAISRVAWGEMLPDLCHSVNVDGTAMLLDTARQQSKPPWFLFVSSREVYGDPDAFPVHEDAPMQPANQYGRSKAQGERLVEAARAAGLRTAIVRLSNVYGSEHDHPDRAIPSLLWRAVSGEELRISGAETFFDFVHVDDCVDGLGRVTTLLAAGREELPTVHLVTGRKTTLAALADAAVSVARSRSPIQVDAPRSFDVTGFYGDPARATTTLGWTARIDLDAGLQRMCALFEARGAPLAPVTVPRPRGQS